VKVNLPCSVVTVTVADNGASRLYGGAAGFSKQ